MSERTYDVLDRPEVLGVLFHPRREGGVPRLLPGAYTVSIPVDQGIAVGGRIFVGKADGPVILYFHGNGEIASDYEAVAPLYTRLGITLFVVDFRGYGASDGTPSATALIADAWAAYEAAGAILEKRNLPKGPLFVMGRSLGSAAAIHIAAKAGDGIKGLIIESGFADTFALVERIGFVAIAEADEDRHGFGNVSKIATVHVPVLFIHGDRDVIIPAADAVALYSACPSPSKNLVRVPMAGHNDLMLVGRKAYFDAIAAFCGVAPAAV